MDIRTCVHLRILRSACTMMTCHMIRKCGRNYFGNSNFSMCRLCGSDQVPCVQSAHLSQYRDGIQRNVYIPVDMFCFRCV